MMILDKDKDQQFKLKVEAFASKTVSVLNTQTGLYETKDLYKRIHGDSFSLSTGGTNQLDFVIPYNHCKVEGIEILNGAPSDSLSMYVLDADGNPYSGLDVGTYGDNVMLNQFAFNVHPRKDFYSHRSQYDADVFIGMILRIVYNNSGSPKTVYMNYNLNEVK